jgi:RNA recognition motif-containing protein
LLSQLRLQKGGEILVNQRLFIGNLPYSIDSDRLRDLFAQAGTVVSAQVMIDRMTNRSRGFGFVEMSSEEETQKAIEMFNEYELDGRKMVVNVARPREERPQGGDRGGYNRGGNDRGGRGGDRGGYRGGRN